MDKQSTAVAVAIITAVAGLGTALIKRVSPAEPAAEASYEALREAVVKLDKGLAVMEIRMQHIEDGVKGVRMISEFGNPKKSRKMERRKKRERISKPVRLPDYTDIQQRANH